MTYQSVTWIVFDRQGKVQMAVDPPYPSQASKEKNPVWRWIPSLDPRPLGVLQSGWMIAAIAG